MSVRRRWFRSSAFVVLAVLVVFLASACGGDPPDNEIQQAQGAIDAARASGADQYAHDEFAGAEDALKQAHAAVDDRDYRLALNHALDAREQAQNAARDAADRKATARVDADRALTAATTALAQANSRLKSAEAAHAPAKTLDDARVTIADGEATVQKARAAFDRGDYVSPLNGLIASTVRLRDTIHDLDETRPSPPKRRR